MLLPTYSKDYHTSNYMRWVTANPQICKHMAIIPSGLIELDQSPLAPPTQGRRLKWNTSMIAIGNAAGYERYMPYWRSSDNGSWREQFKVALTAALTTGAGPDTQEPRIRLLDEQAKWWNTAPTATVVSSEEGATNNSRANNNIFAARASSKFNKKTTRHQA
jgi:hypothetical protein